MSKNKPVGRRQALKTLGATAALPVLEQLGTHNLLGAVGYHPLVPRQQGEEAWTPRFLTTHENETVTLVSELIIPETDTPGAAAARVNQYIDFVLSEEPAEVRDAFRQGLSWLDQKSQELFGKDFVGIEPGQQTEILTTLDAPDEESPPDVIGVRFFGAVKEKTVEGYYRSEVGMIEELEFNGNKILRNFDGCTHPEHLNWEPSAKRGEG